MGSPFKYKKVLLLSSDKIVKTVCLLEGKDELSVSHLLVALKKTTLYGNLKVGYYRWLSDLFIIGFHYLLLYYFSVLRDSQKNKSSRQNNTLSQQ